MSKLQKLIQELCPYGVEYKPLGDKDVSIMQRGTSLTKKDSIEGIYPVISGGKVPAFYCNQFNREGETITVAGSGAGAGYVQYWNEPIFVCDAFSIKGIGDVSTKYLYYCLTNLQEKIYATKKGGGVPHVHIASIEKFLVPIPPPQVQKEIIHILDDFTNLAAELQVELQARKEQYEYYRNKLLTFEKDAEGVKWKRLPDICKNLDRKRKAVTASNRTFGPYPYYGASGIVDYVSSYIFEGNYLLISEDGANLLARSTPIAFSISGKSWVNNHAHVLEFQNMFTQKYIEHYINMIDVSQYVSGGAQPKLNQENLNKIQIPVPSPSEQERIISILDKFETLVNNLSKGLPAEIAAVQEQYEYYRNKLLSFPKVKNCA